uniref:Coiled-coil domain containing 136 n=1 Tax=Rousettus aegyptiacus TaxID=9407 RepID=A0A7J8D4Z6_ROUAE|nr:coiled-coil domain containing 136 [Rousettus aegyptiacus]
MPVKKNSRSAWRALRNLLPPKTTRMRSKNSRPGCGSCSCSTKPAWMSRGGCWQCRNTWRGSCSAARKSFASSKRRGLLLPKKPRERIAVRTCARTPVGLKVKRCPSQACRVLRGAVSPKRVWRWCCTTRPATGS